MKVMRFVGRTSRDAMRKLRDALGPDALVLANRPCAEGVELLATAPGELRGLSDSAAGPATAHAPAMASVGGESADAGAPAPRTAAAARSVESEVQPAGMSTVSFQDYVRQRLRERHHAQTEERASGGTAALAAGARAATAQSPARAEAQAAPSASVHSAPQPAVDPVQSVSAAQRAAPPMLRSDDARPADPLTAVPAAQLAPAPAAVQAVALRAAAVPIRVDPTFLAPPREDHAFADAGFANSGHPGGVAPGLFVPAAPARKSIDAGAPAAPPQADPGVRGGAAATAQAAGNEALVSELQSLKGMIARQFATVNWFEGVLRRSPVQGKLLRTMVAAGFSLKLAQSVVSKLPSDFGEREAQTWLECVLARNVRCAPSTESFEAGGVFALVGPTGVGKTTTTAKIAARHVLTHGAQSVALITVDTYRLGAHDQLRAFGRILGVPVHIAHDASALQDLLRLRGTRQLVLIDTVGMGHRDTRIRSLLGSLPRAEIKHVVVASCAAQAETIDESLRAYEACQAAGVVLTKVDEAARLGGAIDCLLRQRIKLLGVCDGQRVPEDWQAPDGARLVRRALLAPPAGAFALDEEELPLVFGVAATLQGAVSHA
ncbi:MAG: flagellar biosynthesis protein FlhF [Burkholderiales bacterium]|jgi:flagellar biosynthesis protein FlhF